MSLQIFCPAQIKQSLDQSPPRRRQIQWISKRWPLNKTVARKRRVCSAAHPLNWLSARQALNAWLEMFSQAISAQLFPSNSEKTFLIIFTMSLTRGGSPPVVLFHLGLCGAVVQRRHLLGPRVPGLLAGQDPPPHMPGPPPHPHPTTAFFSPAC